MTNGYNEDHLVEQPAIQLMQDELGREVEEMEILDFEFWILNGRGRRPTVSRLNPALSLAEANREIDKLLKEGVKVSFPDPEHGGQRDGAGGRLGNFVNDRLQGPAISSKYSRICVIPVFV